MNNKYFKDKNLGSVLQSGIKFILIWIKMFNKRYKIELTMVLSKNEDQQVGATILDSKTGGLVAISGGRNYKMLKETKLLTLTLLVHH